MTEEPQPELATEDVAAPSLKDLAAATTRDDRSFAIARTILAVFDDYYVRSRRIPYRAKAAFEERNWPATFRLSRDRLTIYGQSVARLAPLLSAKWPKVPDGQSFWIEVEAQFLTMIRGRYEADLAFAFLRSVGRAVHQGEWAPVAYAQSASTGPDGDATLNICRTFKCPDGTVDAATVRAILETPGFKAPWRDIESDAAIVAAEMTKALKRFPHAGKSWLDIHMIDAGFFRNRGAYLVGYASLASGARMPIGMALLNEKDGIYVDAVFFDSDELQYVFSSTLANFHVTSERYHELAQLLASLMPKRPLGLHYSTIGFNHVGKVAVMKEIRAEQTRTGEVLGTAVGFRGTVAIGFSMPSSRYVLKIIRDKPTDGYKWGTFAGVKHVLDKYRLVHEADRAGSMLDNVLYDNVRLDRRWFEPELLDEITQAACQNVTVTGNSVHFKHLIVQMKLVPLTEFLKTASPADAETAVVNLGYCIKNNAAANIFNKDLDGRNYGVSRILKVYLFDYDAVEPLTDVKIRTNTGREDGEEDIPDWYFEEGTVFLPEEMLSGLRIDDPALRRLFREVHGDLLTVDYWEGMQRAIGEGKVPKVRSYPKSRRLQRPLPGKPLMRHTDAATDTLDEIQA